MSSSNSTLVTSSSFHSHKPNPSNPSSNHQALAPESPKRGDLAAHTSRGLAQLTTTTKDIRNNKRIKQESTTYRPRLQSSALFNVETTNPVNDHHKQQGQGQKRDDRMALCEMDEGELEKRRGPRYFHSPEGDEDWIKVEPNSAIRLKSRLLPHTAVQALLSGRLHLPPSLLYSIVRPQFANASKRGWGAGGGGDLMVPVDGDWVTIGVLVEKSPIRITQNLQEIKQEEKDDQEKSLSSEEEEDLDGNDHSSQLKKKKKQQDWNLDERKKPRKFISFKFIDLGHGSYASNSSSSNSSSTAARNSLRGDSILNLMLFESTRSSKGTVNNHGQRSGISETVYTGGSGGAFEKWAKETEGAVVAITSPRIMPLQKNKSSVGQILTMSPTSASSITLIGRSLDYGQCQAMKKDGTKCTAFADKRTSNGICEWHVSNALEKNKSKGGRGEFSNSTGYVTALGSKASGSGSSMSHFKVVKQEKPDFGTSFPIKQEPGLLPKKGPKASYGPSSTKGMEGMLAPKAYHVEHHSSRSYDPLNPKSFVLGLTEKSLPRSHIKASNPQSLLFDVTERFGRGRAEKEERIRKREREEELLLGLLERKAAGEEDEILLREDRKRRGEKEKSSSKQKDREDDHDRDDDVDDEKREYDQDGTEVIRKRKKIKTPSSSSNQINRNQEIDADGNQSKVFMADSTQAITSGGKAIREAQLEIIKRREKAEKLKLEKEEKRKQGKKSSSSSYSSSNSNNPFARNNSTSSLNDASFDRDLNLVLTSRTVSNELYEKRFSDDDEIFRTRGNNGKLKRKPRETTPPYANVRKGSSLKRFQNGEKISSKEKEKEMNRINKGREKGIALNEHDSGSDLESASDQDDDDDDGIFKEPRRNKKFKPSNAITSAPKAPSSSSSSSRVRNPVDALRSSSQESVTEEEIDMNLSSFQSKGKGKERAIDRPTFPGLNDEFSEDSDMEQETTNRKEINRSEERRRESTHLNSSSNSISSAQRKVSAPQKWAHSIDAVKKMGFDPLAGARGFDRKRLEGNPGSVAGNGGSDVKSRLLARLSANSNSLPKPILNPSNLKSKSNLSSIAMKSSKEAKERRLRALKLSSSSQSKGKEKRVGSDSEEEIMGSEDEDFLRDPLLDLDLNSTRKKRKHLDVDKLEMEMQEEDWNSELEEEMKRAEIRQGKKREVLLSDGEGSN